MDERYAGDYELEMLSDDTAARNPNQADRFVQRVEEVLKEIWVF